MGYAQLLCKRNILLRIPVYTHQCGAGDANGLGERHNAGKTRASVLGLPRSGNGTFG